MQCSQCGERDAVVHLTQIANDQVVTLHLCERCAAEKGVESSASLTKSPIGSFLASLGPDQAEQPDEQVPCPRCGGTLANFRDTGRLGCPYDYEVFRDELMPLLENIHEETRHTGKVPRRAPRDPVRQTELIQLRNDLKRAVAAEDYEMAARVRDKIKGIEREMGR